MCAYSLVYVHVCAHACGSQRPSSSVIPQVPLTLFLETRSLGDLESAGSGQPESLGLPRLSSPCTGSKHTRSSHLYFFPSLLLVCVFQCTCIHGVSAGAHGGRESISDALDLEFQAVMLAQVVAGNQTRSSGRVVCPCT